MIAYLEGVVQHMTERHMILDVHGVGYRVTLPAKMMSIIPEIGSRVKIFTHYTSNPRDGNVELYGFSRPEELQFFELLTSVSGIGPRSAQTILGAIDLEMLVGAIMQGDSQMLSRGGGIGPKTAQRLVLELKGKVENLSFVFRNPEFERDSQVIEALVAVGYSAIQARDVLKSLPNNSGSLEDRVAAALKMLGQKK